MSEINQLSMDDKIIQMFDEFNSIYSNIDDTFNTTQVNTSNYIFNIDDTVDIDKILDSDIAFKKFKKKSKAVKLNIIRIIQTFGKAFCDYIDPDVDDTFIKNILKKYNPRITYHETRHDIKKFTCNVHIYFKYSGNNNGVPDLDGVSLGHFENEYTAKLSALQHIYLQIKGAYKQVDDWATVNCYFTDPCY